MDSLDVATDAVPSAEFTLSAAERAQDGVCADDPRLLASIGGFVTQYCGVFAFDGG